MKAQCPRITGIGLVTPLGATTAETWTNILRGHFIADHTRAKFECSGAVCRVSAIGIRAAQEAIAEARWSDSLLASDDTAIVVGTSKGPIESWLSPLSQFTSENERSAGRLDTFGLAEIANDVAAAIHFGAGPRISLSAACASGLHALVRAAMMIRAGEAKRVIVVAAESSLHPIFIGSFQRLGVLARPEIGCRPFDRDRDGFLMSEAAAAVCIESSSALESDDSRIYASIERFCLGADAKHLTAGDPDGVTIRRLLRSVADQRSVDLFHAHGTGTPANDPLELSAIESVIRPEFSPPNVYSHKGALGHSLGAAGLVSIALNCMSHRHGIIPPNVQTRVPIATPRARIAFRPEARPIDRSIAMAAGFGGPIAVVSLVNP